MTKLATLRSQLSSLRRARGAVRQATAWSSLLTAALWALVVVFVLDLAFSLEAPQRLVVMLLAAGLVAWAGHYFARPLLAVRETDEDIALMVERQQQIDSDLVAALQFETPEAARWGSVQLEGAVIDYVAQVGRGINVFEGFSREQMLRRGGLLAATAIIVLIAAASFPQHAGAFISRLFLGASHYPTKTIIERVSVNQREVLRLAEHGSRPADAKCAQGRPISFLVECRGELPAVGVAKLVAVDASRARSSIELKRLTADQRLDRLKTADAKLREAIKNPEVDISGPWRDDLISLVQPDAPQTADALLGVQAHAELSAAVDHVAAAIKGWSGEPVSSALFAGQLDRLVDGVRYKLFFGDAWTDSSLITLIPLPVVEPKLTPLPPLYARARNEQAETTSRQLAVLEGTEVKVALAVKNQKSLANAWVTVRAGEKSLRYDLAKQDPQGQRWQLLDTVADSPFSRVTQELKYELQVIDTDGLSLESPIRGVIRIRPDRPPTGAAEMVHKVVLPTAEPVVQYRANDDYGVATVQLRVEVERKAAIIAPSAGGDEPSTAPAQLMDQEFDLVPVVKLQQPAVAGALPLVGKFPLRLAQLKLKTPLAKGDRVKLVLEIVDFRGDQPGASFFSDPLHLEISDEAGVLAAISEADPKSEERLTDIIKRQLGIGESP